MDKQLRVLFLTTSFPRFLGDSCGSFVFRTAKSLVGSIRIEALMPSFPSALPEDVVDGIPVHRAKYFIPQSQQCLCYVNGGILANIRNSWKALAQVPLLLASMTWRVSRLAGNADLIHCHWLPMVWVAWLGLRLARKNAPIVFTNWGSDTRLLPHWLVKLTLKLVDGCISTAAETDAHLIQCGYLNFAKIPAPVDESRFNSKLDKALCRKYFGIPEDIQFVFCFVARLNYFKDPLTFIRACGVLQSQGVSFEALMAGNGDLRGECAEMVKELGLQERVKLLGDRQDVEYAYRAADVAVHISPIENTWANTIAEAMFCETPVIMTDVGYTRKTFTDGEDCVLVPPKDPEALANKLLLVASTTSLSNRLVKSSKNLLEKHGKDSESVRKRILEYYSQLSV